MSNPDLPRKVSFLSTYNETMGIVLPHATRGAPPSAAWTTTPRPTTKNATRRQLEDEGDLRGSFTLNHFQFPLQPHQKYYITQYEELLRWKIIILPIIAFLFKRLGECTFLTLKWVTVDSNSDTASNVNGSIEISSNFQETSNPNEKGLCCRLCGVPKIFWRVRGEASRRSPIEENFAFENPMAKVCLARKNDRIIILSARAVLRLCSVGHSRSTSKYGH